MASSPDLSRVAGPESMAKPSVDSTAGGSANGTTGASPQPAQQGKKKRHRAGKKRKNKRTSVDENQEQRPSLLDVPSRPSNTESFYRLHHRTGSNTSLESEALLDHREHTHASIRPRRQSLQQSGFTRPSIAGARNRGSTTSGPAQGQHRSRLAQLSGTAISEDDEESAPKDSTPLLASSRNHSRPELSRSNSNQYGSAMRFRRSSVHSRASSKRKSAMYGINHSSYHDDDYDVNNPPSVPHSPHLDSLDDIMVNNQSRTSLDRGRDAVIDIDEDDFRLSETSPDAMRRRPTVHELATRDVCYPHHDTLSDIGDDFDRQSVSGSTKLGRRRTRTRRWPDLDILDEWAQSEKEERTYQDQIRAKKISEPVMIGGRLRPGKQTWHREEDDAPFRFTYFNESFDGTIHARTISDLLQEGATFKDLFQPDPIELADDSEEEDDEPDAERPTPSQRTSVMGPAVGRVQGELMSRQPSILSDAGENRDKLSPSTSKVQSRSETPTGNNSNNVTPQPEAAAKRYGPRPTFWLDILQPTEIEMKVIAKAFGIHQLTIEDILMEEQREKVELFQNYYFLNYRSFEQDKDSPDHMEPVNFYVVVFRDGVITFHHSQTPHPANVRRRIRQLGDYMSPTSDWISYALIDDITDVYGPRVAQIETDVDDIDEKILYLHVTSADEAEKSPNSAKAAPPPAPAKSKKWFKFLRRGSNSSNPGDIGAAKPPEDRLSGMSGGDMLRRVGECRKDVMGLYRLLGNKADVIKGFAKRCNEEWQVAPRSEIGLYLGDIQDHIVTMSSNLSHYESLLSRAHSNYVAQINIRMNERAESNADILGKLTVIGTIVLPMNIITGMWGMNVWVPGQGIENDLTWFWSITAGLVLFGVSCYFIAKTSYGIV